MRGTVTVIVVAVLVLAAVTEGVEESPTSAKMINTVDKTLTGIQNNLYKGMKAMGTPMIKFSVDTMPHLLHIFALTQGVAVHPKLAAILKEAMGRMALFAGTAASDAAVLSTSIMADIARITAATLEVQNDIALHAGEKGIKMGGKLAESLINITSIGVDAAAIGLTALGDTMVKASEVNGAMSAASARLITAIGAFLKRALVSAHDGTYMLGSPLLDEAGKKQQTTNLASYLQTLQDTQKVLGQLVDNAVKEEEQSDNPGGSEGSVGTEQNVQGTTSGANAEDPGKSDVNGKSKNKAEAA